MSEALADHHPAFFKALAVYCTVALYASTVIGPGGLHFVPLDIGTAWQNFRAIRFLPPGALDRQDWVANLLMLVPVGFLATGALWPARLSLKQGLAVIAALTFSLFFVLAVKFAQLFFPPRTVSLEYIAAQSLGSLLGVGLFILSRHPFAQIRARGRTSLTAALGLYAIAFLSFLLFPFDFVLSADDFHQRLAQLPQLLFALPAPGRALPWKLLAIAVDVLQAMPLGFLIGLHCRRHCVAVAGIIGTVGLASVCLVQMLTLSAHPSLAAIPLRVAGIVVGATLVGSVSHLALIRWRLAATAAVPLLIPAYLFAVALTKGVVASHWRTPAEAWAALDLRGLWPLWHDYIVSKSHAAVSLIAHVVLFAPIGVMVWLRGGDARANRRLAAVLAVVLSLALEIGRWFRPDLQPDFNNLVIAGVAAWLAVPSSDWIWRTLVESFPSPGMPPVLRAPPTMAIGSALVRRDQPPPLRGAALPLGWRLLSTVLCTSLALIAVYRYPLSPAPLALALATYATVLWRWPVAWLVVVPAVLPAVDLAPWTGWLYVDEADLFILVTLGVLLLRAPPGRADLALDRLAAAALLLSCGIYLLSTVIGLCLVPTQPTSNPYLSPANALRIAKGFFAALALFPFLVRQIRNRADALSWLSGGMLAGLALVTAATIAERAAFVGLLDFASPYRVVATFSSMHIGGGHVDVYLAMALPFLLLSVTKFRARYFLGLVLLPAAGYALVVTYARTGYIAAIVALAVASFGWVLIRFRSPGRVNAALAPPVLVIGLAIAIGLAAGASSVMYQRVGQSAEDLAIRQRDWARGMDVRDTGAPTLLFGMGLGTYPRVYRDRALAEAVPTNYQLASDDGHPALVIEPGDQTFYFGQKVPIMREGTYTLSFDLRGPDGAELSAIMCEKLLLYSENCTSATFRAGGPGDWEHQRATLHVGQLTPPQLWGWIRRPVDLAFHAAQPGESVEIAAVRLFDSVGDELLRNGSFTRGTEHWFFTDDSHWVWRMFNQFAMLLFEQGILGVVAYAFLTAVALAGLWRAAVGGNIAALPIAAGICAVFVAGFLGPPLEAPRLATLFYLLCFAGLASGHDLTAPTQAQSTDFRR
jgi:VanZ family protein